MAESRTGRWERAGGGRAGRGLDGARVPTVRRRRFSLPGEARRVTDADLRCGLPKGAVDRLMEGAAGLPVNDQALLRAIFIEERPATDVAPLTGRSARMVRKRIRDLTRRVLSPRYQFVLREGAGWPTLLRRVGFAHYIDGRTLRRTARDLGVSLHSVRAQRDAIEALFATRHSAPEVS
jgi:DNA-directed RNA polymerase specialized sigma24 family protein